MATNDNVFRSSINGKLYKTNIVDGKKQVIELQDISFLDKNEQGTYIPRYNIENSRLLLENSEPKEPPTDADVKDFVKEDIVEFPARTQIRNWVRQEFSNRSRNFGMQYTETGESSDYTDYELDTTVVYDSVDLNEHDKKLYKGPKSAWARVCSNAIVADPNDEDNLYKGFILTGNGNFHDTYGFDRGDGLNGGGGEAKTLLGYDLTGKRHEINEPLYKHRPSPGITSIETEDVNPGENFRRTTIAFTCWSSSQLDYLDAYFLQVGVSCCIEWGWNTFPRDSLLPLNEQGMPRIGEIFQNQWNPKREGEDKNPPPMSAHVKKGRGNIGCTIGMIHSFSHSIRPDGGYDCTISVSCMSEIMTALNNKASEKLKSLQKGQEEEEDIRVTDIRHFMTSTLGRLLINEADGEYNPNNYADTKMSEVNDPGADKKLDRAREYNEYFEQGENARQIQEGTANIGVIGISSTKDAKSNLSNFIKQCNQSKWTFKDIYEGHPFKVVAIEGYGGANAFSKDAFVVRPKIYINKLPKPNTSNITDALLQAWKYEMKPDRSYYSDKDWFSTKIYIKKVSNDGKDLATPIANIKPLLNPKKKENYKALKISRGRWFTFDPFSATKPYYAGKQNAGGTYITVSYMLDIFNIFFGRNSNDDQYKICEFSCWGSRAIAHPNIKSTDGSILLIPNALAPRRNSNAERGDFSQSTANMFEGDRNSASYRILKQGENQTGLLGDTTSSFLSMVNSKDEDNPVTSLDEALKKSPRDDLHRILAVNAEAGMNLQHPSLNNSDENQLRPDNNNTSANAMGGKNKYSTDGAFEEKSNVIRPFPDYQYHDTMGSTDGYSGRIGDLFVNMNIIKAEVERNDNTDKMILSIMRQVSGAAGGIWNFKLVGGDTNTSSNHILQLIDANYSGAEPVDDQKRKSWLFKAHSGNSIIRNLSLEVQTTSEVSSQVVFGNPSSNFSPNAKNQKKAGTGMDTKNNYFIRASGDMLLQNVSPSNPPAHDKILEFQKQEGLDPDMASSEKFIVSLKSKGAKTEVINTYKQNRVDGNLDTLSNDISWEYAETNPHPNDPNEPPIPTGKWLPGGPESFPDRTDRDTKIRQYKNDPYIRNIKTAPNNPYKSIGSGSSTGMGNQQKRKLTSFWITKDEIKNIFEKKFKRSRNEITDEFIWKNASSLRGIPIEGSNSEFHYPFDFKKKTSKRSINTPENDAKKMSLDPNITYTIIGFKTSEWRTPLIKRREGRGVIREYWTGWRNKKWFAIDLDSPHKNDKNLTEYTMTAEKELKDQKSKDIVSFRITQSMLRNGKTLDEAKEKMSSYYGTYEKDFEIDVEMVDNDSNRMLNSCRSDVSNPKNNIVFNMPQEGIELSMTLDGIEGLRLYDVFSCTGVPVKYFNTGIFGITGVKHSITGNDWTTDITAQFYPDSSNI